MFDTEFCNVSYNEKDHVVIVRWKQFCCKDDYRNPVNYALSLLQENVGSNLVVDARNGFEDEKEDVVWAFNEFIPNMAKTACKNVVFIMNEVNEIEEEMDMWTREFMKYFKVIRVESYEEAVALLN